MPRISAADMSKREEFIKDLFKKDSALTVNGANDSLKDHFKSKMNPKRVAELRKEVTGQSPKRGRKPGKQNGAAAATPATSPAAAAAAPESQPTRRRVETQGGADLLVHYNGPEARSALEKMIAVLRDMGAQVEIRGRIVQE